MRWVAWGQKNEPVWLCCMDSFWQGLMPMDVGGI